MTTILVAADAQWVRDQVRSAFVGPGQEVVEVTRGQDVRRAFDELEPDLVVLDLQIGNMGGIAVAIKMSRSGKQISGKRSEREVRDQDSYQPLPRADVEPYPTLVPIQQPRSAPNAQDIDDELARLKREMGS